MKNWLMILALGCTGVAGAQQWSRSEVLRDGAVPWLEQQKMSRSPSPTPTFGTNARPAHFPVLKPVETFWDRNGDGVLSEQERTKMRTERMKVLKKRQPR
jgi:hypothetical protein